MARHLKVKAELLGPDFRNVKLTVLEQTHFGKDFGNIDFDYNTSGFTYSKTSLRSRAWGSGMNAYYSTILFVLPNPRCLGTHRASAVIPAARWPAIKKVIAAYNKRYADEE